MTIIFPEATPVLGNIKVKGVLTLAAPAAAKLATEVNAATSLDLSCFLRPSFSPTAETASETAPPRLCTTIDLPIEGRTNIPAFDLRYIYDPQAADTVDANKAKALLQPGVIIHLLLRKGLNSRLTDYAVGQRYETWKVRLGRQNFVTSGDDGGGEFEISQMAFPLSDVVQGVIAA